MLEGNTTPSASGAVAGTQANGSGQELSDATPTSVRKQFAIPKLDEKQLEMKMQETHGTTTPFVVLDGGMSSGTTTATTTTAAAAAATETSSMPLNSNAPAFVFGAGSRYTGANVVAVDSPSASAAYLLGMQCQNPQYQLAHAAPADQELFLTQSMLQMCPREALLWVLYSLMEESPVLAPFIRMRCEKALLLISQQQQKQQAAAVGRFAPHASGAAATAGTAPWVTHLSASSYESPRASSFTNSASPHVGSTRKGRGGKAREEGICSLHNNVRSMNHLQLNKQTGLHECVHGFHCLEDGGSAAVTPCNFKNASTTSNANDNHASKYNSGSPRFVNASPGQPRQTRDGKHASSEKIGGIKTMVPNTTRSSSSSSHGNNNNNNGKSHGAEPTQKGGNDLLWHELSELRKRDENSGFTYEMDTLQHILQTVRELAAKEGE